MSARCRMPSTSLAASEGHRVSKMLRVAAAIGADGSLQLSGDVMSVCERETVCESFTESRMVSPPPCCDFS
jgi:hypothetical protein